jgi:hypothetical protein
MPIANELHNRITGLDAIHELMWIGTADPAATPANDVQPHQWWLDTTGGATLEAGAILKERNAGNTAWTTRADLATALAGKQPLDADLTAIAALTTTSFGRALLALADAAAGRTAFGLGTAALLASDTDTTLAANSDSRVATQKAIKTYVDGIVTGGASDVMIFKGVIDCSANPNYPAADAGHLYKVSVAGKIGGASGPNVEAGDTLYCITDSTASGTQAGVGANWVIAQVNLDGAVIGPTSVTDSRIALFDGTTGKLLKDGGKLLTDLIANTLLTTLGDIIYASAANTPARLAGNTTATKKVLRSTGSGGVATAPAWDTIVENDVGASTNDAGNSSTAITVDWSLARTQKVTLTGNATITHSNMVAGLVYTLELHTGAGSFTGTFASTNWASGTAPTVTAAGSKLDIFTFYKTIGGTIEGGIFGQAFTP